MSRTNKKKPTGGKAVDPSTCGNHRSCPVCKSNRTHKVRKQKERAEELEDEHKHCIKCGRPVEKQRECYVVPICYKCLLPPPSLPIIRIENLED